MASTDPHAEFQSAMARYYKANRDRTEKCLADITDILSEKTTPGDRENKILDRMIEHYSGRMD
jgi:hypothetical protein